MPSRSPRSPLAPRSETAARYPAPGPPVQQRNPRPPDHVLRRPRRPNPLHDAVQERRPMSAGSLDALVSQELRQAAHRRRRRRVGVPRLTRRTRAAAPAAGIRSGRKWPTHLPSRAQTRCRCHPRDFAARARRARWTAGSHEERAPRRAPGANSARSKRSSWRTILPSRNVNLASMRFST